MRKTVKNVVITLLLLTLSFSTALLTYLHFFASEEKELSGEWTAELDMAEQSAVTALGWLQEIEGVSVSLEDMESYMQGLTIQVNLTLDQTERSAGTFQCSVSQESYDACRQAAYEAFSSAFQELLAERLRMAGYTGSMDEEAIEGLITETFGMSTDSYLMFYGPDLLPSLEDLQAQYDGSGTYEVSGDILFRWFEEDGGTVLRTEYFIREDSYLILPEGDGSVASDNLKTDFNPVIYTLKQSTD